MSIDNRSVPKGVESHKLLTETLDTKLKNLEGDKSVENVYDKILVFKEYLVKGSDIAMRVELMQLKKNLNEDISEESRSLLKEIEVNYENFKNGSLKENVFIGTGPSLGNDKFILQGHKTVLANMKNISGVYGVDFLSLNSEEISRLSSKQKIALLDTLKNQSDESSIFVLRNYFVAKLNEGSTDPLLNKEIDKFLYDVLSQLNNINDAKLRLNSLLDGGMAYTGERWIDTKGKFDLDFKDLSTKNKEIWDWSKGKIGGMIENFKDAPLPMKGLVVLAGIAAYKFTKGVASTGKGSKPFKFFKYCLMGIGGYMGVNLLADQYEKNLNSDYQKTNQKIKGLDFAKFFVGDNYNDTEVKASEALIGNLYNPKIHNIEFAKLVQGYKNNSADSASWVKMIDGKDADIVSTHDSIKLLVDRYDPLSKKSNSIHNDKSINENAKKEIKEIWNQAMHEKRKSKNEISFQDVVIRLLAVDPKFTFENQKHLGNDLQKMINEHTEYQSKVNQLQRLYVFDRPLEYLDERTSEYKDLAFIKVVRGITDSSTLFKIQGFVSNRLANIDDIASPEEFRRYKEATKDMSFNFFPKRVSFMGDGISVNEGEKILLSTDILNTDDPKIRSKHIDAVKDGVEILEVTKEKVKPKSTVDEMASKVGEKYDKYAKSSLVYNPSVAVQDRKTFMNDFKVVNQLTGKEIDLNTPNSELFDMKTIPNQDGPVMFRFKDNVALIPKRNNVKLNRYVFYAKEVNFV